MLNPNYRSIQFTLSRNFPGWIWHHIIIGHLSEDGIAGKIKILPFGNGICRVFRPDFTCLSLFSPAVYTTQLLEQFLKIKDKMNWNFGLLRTWALRITLESHCSTCLTCNQIGSSLMYQGVLKTAHPYSIHACTGAHINQLHSLTHH